VEIPGRPGAYRLSPPAVQWLFERLSPYSLLSAPPDTPPEEQATELKNCQRQFRRQLVEKFMSHHHDFDYSHAFPMKTGLALRKAIEQVICYFGHIPFHFPYLSFYFISSSVIDLSDVIICRVFN